MGLPNVDRSMIRVSARGTKLQVLTDEGLQTKQLNGRDHLVVPVIMLVEGVLHSSNAPHPALALAEEFGIFPEGWDGRPVMYGHPKLNGEPVSANLPTLWDSQVIGQLFNTRMKGKKKLRAYMWLDKERAPQEVIEGFENNESFEVSTGLFALEEDSPGEFDGEQYAVIWRNVVPDHLAILPKGSVGACSIDDGCGAPRANVGQQGKDSSMANATGANADQTPNSQQAQTQVIVTNTSAAPGTAAAAAAATEAEAAVAPATSQAPKTNCGCQDQSKSVLANMRLNLGKAVKGFLTSLGLSINELSDMDKRAAIEAAFTALKDLEGSNGYCYVVALFTDRVIYNELDMQTYNWRMYQRSYSVAEGGVVTLGSDVTEVRAETQFVPVEITVNGTQPASQSQESSAATSAPAAPAANSNQPAKEDPMTTPAANNAAAPAENSQAAAASASTAAPAAAASAPAEQPKAPVKANSLEALMEHADDSTKSQLQAIIAANKARRDTLVANLKDKVGLSEDELKALPSESLEKMSAKLNVAAPAQQAADYSGAAGGSANQPSANEDKSYTPITQVFPLPSAAAK